MIDVVVVSYWSSLRIAGLLEGLAGDWGVVVVDNAEDGDPDTRRVCAEHGARVVHHPLGRNTGFGHASNVGASAGAAPYLLFANPDCRVDRAAVDRLLTTLRATPGVAACGPLMADDAYRGQIFGGAAPGLTSALGYLVLPDRLLGRRCVWATTTRSPVPVAVGWLSGACLLVRRQAFESVHGFREDLFMYNEDVDLGERLRRRGWSLLLDPSVTVHHAGGASSSVNVDIAGLWSRSTLRYLGVDLRRRWSVLIALLLLGGMCRRHAVAALMTRTAKPPTFAPQFAAELIRMLRAGRAPR